MGAFSLLMFDSIYIVAVFLGREGGENIPVLNPIFARLTAAGFEALLMGAMCSNIGCQYIAWSSSSEVLLIITTAIQEKSVLDLPPQLKTHKVKALDRTELKTFYCCHILNYGSSTTLFNWESITTVITALNAAIVVNCRFIEVSNRFSFSIRVHALYTTDE